MRIMIVTDQYAPMVGGVPTVTRTLARGLAGRGHAVALLAPSPGRRGSRGAEGRASVYFRGSLPWPWYDGMRLACLPGRAAQGLLTRFAPDVVHVHSPVTLGVTARRAAARLGLPVVYTNHYLPANVRPSRRPRPPGFDALFYSYVVRFSNRCTHVTAPTATALRLLRDRGLRVPSRVISNGVDLPVRPPGPPDAGLAARYGLHPGRPLILTVSRLSPEKRVDVLLDAAARLTVDAQLAIAGTGPDEAGLRDRAAGWAWPGGCGSSASFPAPTWLACTGWPTCSPSRPRRSCRAWPPWRRWRPACPSSRPTPARSGNWWPTAATVSSPPPAAPTRSRRTWTSSPRTRGCGSGWARLSLQAVSGHERGRGLAEWESLYRLLAGPRPAGLAR